MIRPLQLLRTVARRGDLVRLRLRVGLRVRVSG